MAKRERLGLVAIRTEGAILPPSILQRIHTVDEKLAGLRPADFDLDGTRVREAASQAWNALQGPWLSFKSKRSQRGDEDTSFGPSGDWVRQILRALDYGAVDVSGRGIAVGEDGKYRISALLGAHAPLYVVGHGQLLDKRPASGGLTPHGNVQLFLNTTEANLWGFVTNGLRWRILRDSVSLSRQAMVEIDLEAIFEGGLYDEFLLFFLLCHQSRLRAERPSECWLEKWSQAATETGKRALDTLRDGVQKAIEALGQGFLRHPTNTALRERLRSGELDKQDYYRQILRLVYRLLFLFVAEDRGLLLSPDSTETERRLYREAYSTQRLRVMAERIRGAERHYDLYIGLKLVMRALGESGGLPELGIAPLGGLFKRVETSDLDQAELANASLMEAIRFLAVTREGGRPTRVDYLNLGSEELGSVYESLLELHPELSADGSKFALKSAQGNERKTSGSYYTPDSLIQCLLDTALEPVLAEAISSAKSRFKQVGTEPVEAQAILDLRVLDPAVGSGHFLIAAAHRLAKRLAQVRTGDEEPSPDSVRSAVRDVVSKCLYGVDINPMSAELCKVALWMEAMEPGKPLGFLDSRIKVGNSLLGATPELIAEGIPDSAYDAVRDPVRRAALKKRNKSERLGNRSLFLSALSERQTANARKVAAIERQPEENLEQVRAKERHYEDLTRDREFEANFTAADLWASAFSPSAYDAFTAAVAGFDLTTESVERADELPEETLAAIRSFREQYRFFHFHFAFQRVFEEKGGFDVVLGNPPWERVKLQEKEFFASRAPEIANAQNAAARRRLIAVERDRNSRVWQEYSLAQEQAETEARMLTKSGRFPLTGRGDVNTYSVFAELARSLLNANGRTGIIVPTGIATDDTTKFFFQDLVSNRSLHSYYGFKNERFLFPKPVEHTVTFGLLTMLGTNIRAQQMEFAWLCWTVEEMQDPERRILLTPEDINLLNPNTRTCPVFRTKRDAEITKAIYRRVPVLIREGEPNGNPWGISFQRMFDMSNDSELFRTRQELEEAEGCLDGNQWVVPKTVCVGGRLVSEGCWLPLYEAKMIHHFDHRWATYETVTVAKGKKEAGDIDARDASVDEKCDPSFVVQPRYWVLERAVDDAARNTDGWFIGFRNICRSTDVRTAIFGPLPRSAVGHSTPLVTLTNSPTIKISLLACVSSFAYDYVVRQKLGGTNFTYGYVNQVSVLDPVAFLKPCGWDPSVKATEWIAPRVFELTYTSEDMTPLARDLGYDGPPFAWDEERRFLLRAELDAAFFHLYGIDRDDVDYIMDTFHVVRDNDLKAHGHYRTKETILEIYDEMAIAMTESQLIATELPPSFPEGEMEYRLCATVNAMVQLAPSAPSREVLVGALLAMQPSLCRPLLDSQDQRRFDREVSATAIRPTLDARARLPWVECRDYLEQLGAIRVDRTSTDQRLTAQTPLPPSFSKYEAEAKVAVAFAVIALRRFHGQSGGAHSAIIRQINALVDLSLTG